MELINNILHFLFSYGGAGVLILAKTKFIYAFDLFDNINLFDGDTNNQMLISKGYDVTTSVGDYDTLNESIKKSAIKINRINITQYGDPDWSYPYKFLKKDVDGNIKQYYELTQVDPNQRQKFVLNAIPTKPLILDVGMQLTFTYIEEIRFTFYWSKLIADSSAIAGENYVNQMLDTFGFDSDNHRQLTDNYFYIHIALLPEQYHRA